MLSDSASAERGCDYLAVVTKAAMSTSCLRIAITCNRDTFWPHEEEHGIGLGPGKEGEDEHQTIARQRRRWELCH